MANVSLNLRNATPLQVVALANQIKTALTGNATFPSPNPSLATLDTAITATQGKIEEFIAAEQALRALLSERDAAVMQLRVVLRLLSAYVQNVSGGDAVKIQSAGMNVRQPGTRRGEMSQALNFVVEAGVKEGELRVRCRPVPGARVYEVQVSPEPPTSTSWTLHSTFTRSRGTIGSLPSGSRMWARMRAIGTSGAGAWSDPGVKVVP